METNSASASSLPPHGAGSGWNGARACGRALGALAVARAELAWLEGRSTSEQLPAGHWLVISPENLLDRLVALADQVQAVIEGLQGLSGEPGPDPAWGLDLVVRLRAFCRRFLADTGIRCELTLHTDRMPLGQQACEAVYWALCELLANVRKHACATRVTVSSGLLDGGFIYFRVADDGVGMRRPPLALERHGLGLWNVGQHLSALGGSVDVENNVRGLTVTLVLPVSVPRAGLAPLLPPQEP